MLRRPISTTLINWAILHIYHKLVDKLNLDKVVDEFISTNTTPVAT